MGTYFLLSLYLQQVQAYGPIRAGLATLPAAAGIVLSAGFSTSVVERLPVRAVSVPGLLIAGAGLAWFSTLGVDSGYATHVLPALFLAYFGLGMGFIPMTLAAVAGVPENQSGVASAVLNTAQQLGAALGIAVLSTISAATTGKQVDPDGTHRGLHRRLPVGRGTHASRRPRRRSRGHVRAAPSRRQPTHLTVQPT